jgi:spermidine/putrescine transport system ATP-binding protein
MQASVVGEEFVGATAIIHLEGAEHLELKAQKSHEELEQLNLAPGARKQRTYCRANSPFR